MHSRKIILANLVFFIVAGLYCAKPKKPMINELPTGEGDTLSEFACSDGTKRRGTSQETACQGLGGDGTGVSCSDGGRAASQLECSQTVAAFCSNGEVKRIPPGASAEEKALACGDSPPIIEPEPTTQEYSCAEFGEKAKQESVVLPIDASAAEIEEECTIGEPTNPPTTPETGAAACGTSNPDISAEKKIFYYSIKTRIRSAPDHNSTELGWVNPNSGNYAVLKCTDSGSQPSSAGYTSWVCINANGVTGWTWVGEFAHKCATLKTE
ncbi:MAG: hypothetical protein KBD78_08695 [Oligoflexales bacterium]|nr:hypothetical protein [Oligoflexales bacterium]